MLRLVEFSIINTAPMGYEVGKQGIVTPTRPVSDYQ